MWSIITLINIYQLKRPMKPKSAGLVLKNRSKSLLSGIVCDCMVYLDPKFLICKTWKWPNFFFDVEGWFFFISCYHLKRLRKIHWNKIFCGMYGLGVMLTMTTSKLHLSIQIGLSVSTNFPISEFSYFIIRFWNHIYFCH